MKNIENSEALNIINKLIKNKGKIRKFFSDKNSTIYPDIAKFIHTIEQDKSYYASILSSNIDDLNDFNRLLEVYMTKNYTTSSNKYYAFKHLLKILIEAIEKNKKNTYSTTPKINLYNSDYNFLELKEHFTQLIESEADKRFKNFDDLINDKINHINENLDMHRQTLTDNMKNIENEVSKRFNNFDILINAKINQINDNLAKQEQDLVNKIQNKEKYILEQYNKKLTEQTEKLQNLNSEAIEELDKTRIQLNNTTQALKEEIKLKESKKYWEEKANRHRYSSYFLLFTFICSIIGIVTLIFYFDTNEIIKDIKNNSFDNGNFIIKHILYIFLISLSIWMSRIILKMYFSNLHLKEEAKERETMIMTYLALITEGAMLNEDDKKIILEAIFRPSTNGLIKDDSAVILLDLVKSIKK